MPSSSASSTFRIDWRPSRWLQAGLVGLGLLAAASLLVSGLPWLPAAACAVAAVAWGVVLALRERRRPSVALVLAGQGVLVRPPGSRAELLVDPQWQLRGPLAVLRARDQRGCRRSYSWWPDTLPPAARRQLRMHRDLSSRYDKPLPSVAA